MSRPRRKTPHTILWDPDLWTWLTKEAHRRHMTRSAFIHHVLWTAHDSITGPHPPARLPPHPTLRRGRRSRPH
jgi:hypothetical protein